MRFYFHRISSQAVEYDEQGSELPDRDFARIFAQQLIRTYFLAHPRPSRHLLYNTCLGISDKTGYVEEILFAEAFASEGDPMIVHYDAGNA
jgi:hypothetical protein